MNGLGYGKFKALALPLGGMRRMNSGKVNQYTNHTKLVYKSYNAVLHDSFQGYLLVM